MTRKIASPKITGGGGDVFEDKVVAFFMACLLTELPPLDPNLGVLVALDFQTKASGWLFDDLLMTLSSSVGETHASFSIKSYPQFTRKSAPTDFVVGVWEQYLHIGTTKFEKDRDILGLIAPPHGTAVKREIDGLLNKTRSQRPVDFVERIEQPGFLSKPGIELFHSFGCPRALATQGSSTAAETTSLLARLRVLEFDFESNSSVSLGNSIQTCRSALLSEALDEAQNLWHTLVAFAAELRPHAGHVDLFTLLAELRGKFALKTSPSHRRDWDRLKTHTLQTLSAIPDKIGQKVSISRAQESQPINDAEDAEIYASFSDQQVSQYAKKILELSELPPERFAIVERDCFSRRDISTEKLNWCRHLELIQDLEREQHPATHYAKDPTRYCKCILLGYESRFGDPDWHAIIRAFKRAYCDGCSEKAPYQPTV